MSARAPDSPHPPSHERFPLAARALRTTTNPAKTASHTGPPSRLATGQQTRTRNNWPLYLFVFLLPLQNVQTGYIPNFGGGLNFLNIMTALSLVGAMAIHGRLAVNEPVNRWVLAYAAYAVISLLVGYQFVDDGSAHLAVLKDHLFGLMVVYLVQMSVNDWTGVRRVLIATILPLPYIARVTWAQHISVASWHYSDDLRISGTFSMLGANEFAAFCVTVAVVLFALLIAARLSRRWKIGLCIGLACMVMGVLYAYSRTAYISLILGLVTVILVWRGRWKLLLPLVLAAAILPGVLPYSVVERFDSTDVEADHRDESTELRFVYWQVAWDNFIKHPVVGTGFHSFHHREINPYGKDTHNLYLRTLTEGGLIGGAVLLGLLLAVLRTALRELNHSHSGTLRYALALGLVGAWTALVCSNLFGDRFTYYPMAAYFWAYVALVVKARHLPAEDHA
jgi:O-antigen ligase